ncbi:MAG: hypothetical protein WDN50_04055 [Bradyrhizobium sp.]
MQVDGDSRHSELMTNDIDAKHGLRGDGDREHSRLFGPIAAWKMASGLLSSTSSAFGTAFDV